MARRSVVLLLCILTTVLAAAQAPESVDAAAIAKIRDEGLNRSQVMETMFWLTDRYGPRLTGSKEFEEAGDWAVKQLQDWGVANVKKERFPFGRGWSLVKFHATMTEPRVMPIIGLPKSWTPGTSGLHSADVVRPQITNAQDAEKWRGKLRGKIVLTQPAREVRMLEGPIVLRYADDPKWIEEALSMPPARGAGAGRAAGAGRGGGQGRWRLVAARGRRARPAWSAAVQRQHVLSRGRRAGAVRSRIQQRHERRRQRSDVADAARGRRHGVRVVRRLGDRRSVPPCCRRSRSRSSTTTAWSGCSITTRR